jgi:hypothetical protein
LFWFAAADSGADRSFDIASAVQHMKDYDILVLDAVDDDITADCQTTQTNAKVVVTATA